MRTLLPARARGPQSTVAVLRSPQQGARPGADQVAGVSAVARALQSFSPCLLSKKSFHGSNFLSINSGTFLIVKSEILTPFSTCCHVRGIDTVAFGFAGALSRSC